MLLEGLHIPLTTPFHPDGRLALPKLESNVARYSKTPAAGLIILGPSAEPTLLSDDETRDVLRTAAQAAAPEKVLLAGIARDSVRSVLALADFAAQLHYDAILVGVPPVLALEGLGPVDLSNTSKAVKSLLREQRTFFQTVADRSELPVILLSVTGRFLRIPDSVELASHPNIIGIVHAGKSAEILSGRIRAHAETGASIRREVTVTNTFAAVTARMKLAAEATAQTALVSVGSLTGSATAIAEPPALAPALRTRTKSVGFQILSGNSSSLLAALNAGATGIAPAFAAAAPQACYEVYAAWKDGDQSLAEEKQSRIREAAALAGSLGPGGLKYACDLNGYAGGLPRLPHLPPNGEQCATLEALMHPLRN
ncbi:MAG TPA: dihydrodipicolinate synthase family protein [Acidobacteriaceae bacterium]|nr:dihydrodipicolinate synthase family protein [Acidobacteriaceae bacterium]